ncbi:AAA family ATPase [Microbacterium sp. DT81.1]|uniref:AAA family ATPase n=1 Tax=Microbacterium sp. DT81.1 TaxID=3393413 RepID=UPI003CF42C4B
MHETLLRAVVNVALQPSACFVGRGYHACTGLREAIPMLGVRDGRGHQICEWLEAVPLRVGLAFVDDTNQALPVGHAGAMESATRHANASVELDAVHRFRDPEYAALALWLRNSGDRDALEVAGELVHRGYVERVDQHDAARTNDRRLLRLAGAW